jgi:AcrR family transcriptional regulator
MTSAVGPRRGRPRDVSIDNRALEATRRLLIEEGHAATTIQRIAERSGVHASAIYRRWPSRRELIQDAAYAEFPPGSVRPTGDLRRDLRRFLRAYVEGFDSPIVRAAMPALLADSPSEPLARAPEAWLRLSMRPQFRDILGAAPPHVVDPEVDADDVFDLLLGAVLVQLFVPEEARRRPPIGRTVDLLVRLLAPKERSGHGGSTRDSLARR